MEAAAADGLFPVTLVSRDRALRRRAVRGRAAHYDDKELRVRAEAPVERGAEVRIRFEAPGTLADNYGGMACDFPGRVLSVSNSRPGPAPYELTLAWGRPLKQLVDDAARRRRRFLGAMIAVVLSATVSMGWANYSYFWYEPALSLYTMAIGAYFFSRFFLACFHRPPPASGYEPTISVVISIRNDKDAISVGVSSCYATDYPPEKREVIVIDDGSTDETPQALVALQKRFPELKVFTIPPSGKRFGMAKGIREAKGEIIVVIDSDSAMDRDTMRNIVRGFEDPTLGAVAGFTGVINSGTNMLTRIQELRYLVSFELMKTAESIFGCVTCCPGCLSAYRKEYLLRILDPWLKQTFWGVPSTFGDDRSLTNYIMREHRVIYNPLARAATFVPETWGRYMKQQCRWKKSWLREAPIAGRILARKHPAAALAFYVSGFCSLVSPLMIVRIGWLLWTGQDDVLSAYLAGLCLLSLLLALFALYHRPTKYWYVTWLWVGSQILFMGPQTYYALLTVRRSHWGTR